MLATSSQHSHRVQAGTARNKKSFVIFNIEYAAFLALNGPNKEIEAKVKVK